MELGKNVSSSLVWQNDKYYNSFVVRHDGPPINNARGRASDIHTVISSRILQDKHNNDPVLTFFKKKNNSFIVYNLSSKSSSSDWISNGNNSGSFVYSSYALRAFPNMQWKD